MKLNWKTLTHSEVLNGNLEDNTWVYLRYADSKEGITFWDFPDTLMPVLFCDCSSINTPEWHEFSDLFCDEPVFGGDNIYTLNLEYALINEEFPKNQEIRREIDYAYSLGESNGKPLEENFINTSKHIVKI